MPCVRPKNDQTHVKNLAANAAIFVTCVWPFCGHYTLQCQKIFWQSQKNEFKWQKGKRTYKHITQIRFHTSTIFTIYINLQENIFWPTLTNGLFSVFLHFFSSLDQIQLAIIQVVHISKCKHLSVFSKLLIEKP